MNNHNSAPETIAWLLISRLPDNSLATILTVDCHCVTIVSNSFFSRTLPANWPHSQRVMWQWDGSVGLVGGWRGISLHGDGSRRPWIRRVFPNQWDNNRGWAALRTIIYLHCKSSRWSMWQHCEPAWRIQDRYVSRLDFWLMRCTYSKFMMMQPHTFSSGPCVPEDVQSFTQCENNIGSVSWAKSDGAESYMAIAVGQDGHTHMCTTNTTSCTWDDLHCGEQYTIQIVANDYLCSSMPSSSTSIRMGKQAFAACIKSCLLRQNKASGDITLGSRTLWWAYFLTFYGWA